MPINNRSVSLQVDDSLLPIIYDSYRYQATRALLCGDKVAFEAMNKLAEETREMCPPVSLWFRASEWFELIQAVRTGHSYSIAPPRGYSSISISVEALNKELRSVDFKIQNGEANQAKVREYLDEQAPMRD